MNKYNPRLFWVGFVSNIVAKLPLLLLASVLGIVGIWKRPCLYIALVLLSVILVWSLVQQLRIKYTVEHNEDPNFAPFADAMTRDDWPEEIRRLVEDRIQHKPDGERPDGSGNGNGNE